MLKYSEYLAHTIALTIAIFGPLVNVFFIGFSGSSSFGMYIYWMFCLLFYIIILIPFTFKSPLTLIRLIFLGITIEDFFSNLWRSLLLGKIFLPFCNWYTEYFPFIGSLGEPTPLIMIPKWYFLSILVYIIISIFQYKRRFRESNLNVKNR